MYDIRELCREAGITPRTVHYYIQQGLLPPAGSQGPGARYGEGHLARLKLIRLLQNEHLPLSEIRRRIESLEDGKVQELVAEYASQKPPAGSSAVEYIRGVLAGTHHTRLHQASENVFRSHASLPVLGSVASAGSAHFTAERSQWERIVLDTDVELHIRRPLSRSQNKKIEAVIQFARETLKEGSL